MFFYETRVFLRPRDFRMMLSHKSCVLLRPRDFLDNDVPQVPRVYENAGFSDNVPSQIQWIYHCTKRVQMSEETKIDFQCFCSLTTISQNLSFLHFSISVQMTWQQATACLSFPPRKRHSSHTCKQRTASWRKIPLRSLKSPVCIKNVSGTVGNIWTSPRKLMVMAQNFLVTQNESNA